MAEIDPKLIVVGEAPSEDLFYHSEYNMLTQNSAGDITFECVNGETHIYVSNENHEVHFLEDYGLKDKYGKYTGTLFVQ